MKKRYVFLSIVFATSIIFAANYPFPQNRVNFGIKATTAAASDVQAAFDQWKKKFYEENGTEARIKFDDKTQTVSEGIGYGMLIMVCMDNSHNSTQDEFDKLWSYYKKHCNGNGLMNWKINGFSDVVGKNGATDGDLDAATGLVLAFRQWGNEKYRTDARELIEKIWTFEVNADKYLKPGDAWDTKKNPSYFSTGALELFKSVDTHDWDAVIKNSYTLIKTVANSSSGLVPDWCSQDGNTQEGEFGYDAVRTPWRLAWAYAWFGHPDAATICTKMATWIRSSTNENPAAIKSGYTRSGSAQVSYSNATYTGLLSCAGMVSSTNQDFINKGFTATKSADAGSYYNKTIQVLTLLMLSGNMTTMSDPAQKR
jgi:endo-1,4-beta-D-glucanase Y